MNVQRLIDKYGEKFKLISKDYPYDRALSELWYDIKQLDKPQKVKVSEEEEKFLKRLILTVKMMLQKLYIMFHEWDGVII